ncbi:MAG: alpha/beta hydrolase family protein [Gordonia sp. (in: high G+C Gram-positive bacteria)]|uniref:alpha/beta hydrolase n=1 Tax=Gordonia sp. (in: high G+C Gram-positive bacteria) TaxID=84139 RepID=UPI003BB4AF61
MATSRPVRVLVGIVLVGIVLALLAPMPAAQARPPAVVSVETLSPGHVRLQVFSAASRRVIPVDVLLPANRGRAPTLYLLNGAGGGEDTANWLDQGRAPEFFADKNVNVVIPMSGSFSYYTDWRRDDPMLGRHRWETFLTRELPPLIDQTLSTTGRNAVAGLSMSGSAALLLAERAPGRYVAAASFSGCPNTSGPLGSAYVRMTVEGRGAGDVTNMWGPLGGPDWTAHDAEINANRLRGIGVFVSAGPGLPGRYDNPADPAKLHQILIGGPIEAAVRQCSQQFVDRLHQLGIPVTTYFPATGTHAFAYWHDALKQAWPLLSRYLNG